MVHPDLGKQAAVFDASRVGFVVCGQPPNCQVDQANKAAEKLLGQSPLGCICTSLLGLNQNYCPIRTGQLINTEANINGHALQISSHQLNPTQVLHEIIDPSSLKPSTLESQTKQALLHTMFQVTNTLLEANLSTERTLDMLLMVTNLVVPSDTGSIILIDTEGQTARIVRSRGFEQQSRLEDIRFDMSIPHFQYMINQLKPLAIPNTAGYDGWQRTPETESLVSSSMLAPIIVGGKVIGFIDVDSKEPDYFTPQQADLLQQVARQAAKALQNASLFEETYRQAIIEPLTGLFNRRYLEEAMVNMLDRARRKGTELGIVMIDIDCFKQFNDRFGHDVGDIVLKEISDILKESFRPEDVVARFGGEEFAVLVEEANREFVVGRLKKIQEKIRQLVIKIDGALIDPVTLSFGMLTAKPSELDTNLLRTADQALYRAKEGGGRNCIWVVDAQGNNLRVIKGNE